MIAEMSERNASRSSPPLPGFATAAQRSSEPPAITSLPPPRPAFDEPVGALAQGLAINDRFGFVFVNGVTEPQEAGRAGSPDTWYRRALAAGAGWTRWPIYRNRIETQPGQFDYTNAYPVDRVVELDVRYGLRTDAILVGTPAWGGIAGLAGPATIDISRKRPPAGEVQLLASGSEVSPPQGLDRPVFLANGAINPENHWARFVYQTVNRYKPGGVLARQLGWGPGQGITHWEMWNEPDQRQFWLGSPSDYYLLLKAGYLAARAADPNAVILFAGLMYWEQPGFLGQVLDRLVADPEGRGNRHFFDVLPLHFYVEAEHAYSYPQWARSELQKRGLSKPIWINETNAPIWGDTTGQSFWIWLANLEEQASHVIQSYAYALAAGVERAFVFQLYEDGEPCYGIIRSSDAPRPAYTAHQVAATYFLDAQFLERATIAGAEVISFLSPTRGKLTVAWSRGTSPAVVSLPAAAPSASLVDKYGNTSAVVASNNAYPLSLPAGSSYSAGGTTWQYGGPPYILVEPITVMVSSRVNPLPALATSRGFRVSWSRLDGVGGSATFDVQFRSGSDPRWYDWLTSTTQTSATFGPDLAMPLIPGQTYYFRVRARLVGQLEAWPLPDETGDAHTTIVRVDPQARFPLLGKGYRGGW